MAGERYSASQSANLIRSWLEEDSEEDDTYCSIAESSDDEIENVFVEDAAEADDSSSSSAEENDVLINSAASTASAEYFGKSRRRWSDTPPPTSRTRGCNIFTVGNWGALISTQNKVECFDSFFPPAMLSHIVKYTNQLAVLIMQERKCNGTP